MRKQIAAANWKMNLTYQEGEKLLDEILSDEISLEDHHQVIFAVPSPYLVMATSEVADERNNFIAAQNCHHKDAGAYTGEVSAKMLQSMNIHYCIVGHSERREYFAETNAMLAQKIDCCFENRIIPIFCCGESLSIREAGTQNEFVEKQLRESLFHLTPEKIQTIVIAYEPIWAIGTGKTASTAQAQEIHAFIRSVIAGKFGDEVANEIPILYGGSVKANNASELFSCNDVDGGLVGGASLVAADFSTIIRSLK
jgi:triosephosphate isomerase (TIM)